MTKKLCNYKDKDGNITISKDTVDYVNNLQYPVNKVEVFFDDLDHSNYLGFNWQMISQGRVPVGLDTNDTDFNQIGKIGGSKELQKHSHKTGIIGDKGLNATLDGNASAVVYYDQSLGLNTTETGDGNSGNLQPYVVMAFWQRVS